jgi:hypothetical protein
MLKFMPLKSTLFLLVIVLICQSVRGQTKNVLTIKGTGFGMNGQPFEYTGVSFFNAIYNPDFNKNTEIRKEWLRKFKDSGINVLRVWCQWDNARGFIDGGAGKTLYNVDGSLKPELVSRVKEIVTDADREGMVILLVLFSRESWNENIRLSDSASDLAVAAVTKEFLPWRNLVLQVWNEFDYRAVDYLQIIKSIDPTRLVTNSPGYGGVLGKDEENQLMDFLSPHTSRNDNNHWELAIAEIGQLIEKYKKPVVDDEPARKGTPKFGGPKSPTSPNDHILQIYNVWKAGGYVVYHHDMFQTGYGTEAVPANGIPAPGFNAYHDQVFSFLKDKERYLKLLR